MTINFPQTLYNLPTIQKWKSNTEELRQTVSSNWKNYLATVTKIVLIICIATTFFANYSIFMLGSFVLLAASHYLNQKDIINLTEANNSLSDTVERLRKEHDLIEDFGAENKELRNQNGEFRNLNGRLQQNIDILQATADGMDAYVRQAIGSLVAADGPIDQSRQASIDARQASIDTLRRIVEQIQEQRRTSEELRRLSTELPARFDAIVDLVGQGPQGIDALQRRLDEIHRLDTAIHQRQETMAKDQREAAERLAALIGQSENGLRQAISEGGDQAFARVRAYIESLIRPAIGEMHAPHQYQQQEFHRSNHLIS